MNKRTLALIQSLNQLDKVITIDALAEEFKVSARTIRNDISKINELLVNNGFQETSYKSGGRIIREKDFINLLPLVAGADFYSYKLSKEERKEIATVMLVSASGYITLSAIADSLFVSRATIINDLDEIKEYIAKEGMAVLSHSNKGLRVDGEESVKRRFLLRMVANNDPSREFIGGQISVQAGNKIIIQKILNEQEHAHKSHLTDHSFQKVMNYLGIMVNRNMQGDFIETQTKKSEKKYTMAQDILRYVCQYCHINTTEDEICYLSNMLHNCKYIKGVGTNSNMIKIQMVTRRFIDAVSKELGIRLYDDYDFFESLSNHLQSSFTEIAPVFPENPIIDEVLEEHPDIVEAVDKCKYIITEHMTREMSVLELGYIAIHICAALERKKNKEIAFHVIVACHAGIGTSQLLLEKLKSHFNFHIVDIVSSHEAKRLEADKADFIISTIPLEGCKIEYVVVSPLLTDEDYIRVGNKIDALRNSRRLPDRVNEQELSAKGLIEKLNPIVYEAVPDKAPELMKDIRRVIRQYFNQAIEAEAEIFAPSLHHLLFQDHIHLDVECTDWRDAIRKASEHLLKRGYIEERYIESMIKNVEENGPYVVLSPGFAVPHDAVENGSIKVGMNLIRLKTPVEFGEEEFDPVEFVCVLSAVDHTTHLKAFFNLVNMLQDADFKWALHEAKTSEEAARVIEQFEYTIGQ